MSQDLRRRIAVTLLAVLTGLGCPGKKVGPCTADSDCTSPQRCCSGTCVDVKTSVTHCGSCVNSCGSSHAAARCTAGVCQLLCSSGFGDCNSLNKDGCETELTTSSSNCGSCGMACQFNNASGTCDRSLCQQVSCNSGYGDCNLSTGDGCEVNLRTTLNHCGKCGHKCVVANGEAKCLASACEVAGCDAGFGDCDNDVATGCEVDLTSDDAHCNACGTPCPFGNHCKKGVCVAPELIFYGGIANLFTSQSTDQVTAFNIDTHVWKTITVDLDAGSPGPRSSHIAIWDTTSQRMLVWGGYTSGFQVADDDLWALDFNVTPPAWKRVEIDGGSPRARADMGSAWDSAGRRLYIFSGGDYNFNTMEQDLWVFDVATSKWTQLEGGEPPGRFYSSGVWDSANHRALFGLGADLTGFIVNDFWSFDPSIVDGGWAPLDAAGTPPTGREGAIFVGDTLPLMLWGGVDQTFTPTDELYSLAPAADDAGVLIPDGGDVWTLLMPSNPINARSFNTAVNAGTRRFLFGGYVYVFQLVQFRDVWELDPDAGWIQVEDGGGMFDDGGLNTPHPGIIQATGVAKQ